MNSGLTFLSAVTVGLAVTFLELQPAVATTFSLPLGTSENTFSFTTAPSEELFVGPVVSIDSNGCPGDGCPNSSWNVAVAVDFYSETSGLLASNAGNVTEECTASDCSVPSPLSFSIPDDAASFTIVNDVSVGGGWLFESASETIFAGGSPLVETPNPAAFFPFVTGIILFGLLSGWRREKTLVS